MISNLSLRHCYCTEVINSMDPNFIGVPNTNSVTVSTKHMNVKSLPIQSMLYLKVAYIIVTF